MEYHRHYSSHLSKKQASCDRNGIQYSIVELTVHPAPAIFATLYYPMESSPLAKGAECLDRVGTVTDNHIL